MAFPAKALAAVAFSLLSEASQRVFLRILVADHNALVGQAGFEAKTRRQRQFAYPRFVKFVRNTAGVSEDDAVVTYQNHAEKDVKANKQAPRAEGLHGEQRNSDEENETMINERDDEQDDNGYKKNAAGANLIINLFPCHSAGFGCALIKPSSAEARFEDSAQNVRNAGD